MFNRFRKRLDKPKTSFVLPTARAILPRGSGDRALQECNLSTEPSMDCSDCIPPGPGTRLGRVFASWDASASHGQSEKLIVSPAVRPPFFTWIYPQILLQTPNNLVDSDGNLTLDGRWQYNWNGEYRLVRMESREDVPNEARQRLEFAYDWQGRRIRKSVSVWDPLACNSQPSTTNLFVCL